MQIRKQSTLGGQFFFLVLSAKNYLEHLLVVNRRVYALCPCGARERRIGEISLGGDAGSSRLDSSNALSHGLRCCDSSLETMIMTHGRAQQTQQPVVNATCKDKQLVMTDCN